MWVTAVTKLIPLCVLQLYKRQLCVIKANPEFLMVTWAKEQLGYKWADWPLVIFME